jgi:hypothetical protein
MGNGSGNVNIEVTDHGGWITIYPTSVSAADDFGGDLALGLAKSLNRWIEERPKLRTRFVVPITRNGRTFELYAWYEKEPSPAATVPCLELLDHQLADADLNDFRQALDRLGASLEVRAEAWTSPGGVAYQRLTQCRVLAAKGQLEKIDALCAAHGFRPKRKPA